MEYLIVLLLNPSLHTNKLIEKLASPVTLISY
jgi:hypothetical protein